VNIISEELVRSCVVLVNASPRQPRTARNSASQDWNSGALCRLIIALGNPSLVPAPCRNRLRPHLKGLHGD
jgi:hypothetical protein